MKAAVMFAAKEPLVIEEVQVDEPQAGEALIKTSASGVCHSDLHFMEGKYRTRLPAAMGHESAGVVEAVGSDVTSISPGDHVVTCLSVFCGHCNYCLSGRPFLCLGDGLVRDRSDTPRLGQDGKIVHQFANVGSFAETMLVHEHAVVKIDPEMPLDRAALLGCAVTTGLGAVLNTAQVRPGSTVAVVGCGGIGLNCVQGARLAGAGQIIAIDAMATKLEMARHFGATDLIDASTADAVAAVQDATGGGVEYAFEAIGLKRTVEQAFAMTARGGMTVVIGMVPEGTDVAIPASDLVMNGKQLVGSVMGSNRFRIDLPRYVRLYLDGRLLLDELLSARIKLDDVNDGFAAMRAGLVARSVVVFDAAG